MNIASKVEISNVLGYSTKIKLESSPRNIKISSYKIMSLGAQIEICKSSGV